MEEVEDEVFNSGTLGQGAAILPAEGDSVKKGDLLLEFDRDGIQSAGYPLVTPMVICNPDDYDTIDVIASGEILAGADFIRFTKN